MRTLLVIICGLVISTSSAWYTGPDGKTAQEGTPEYAANRYLKKMFALYGMALNVSGEMGEEMLAKLMTDLGLGVIHKLPNSEIDVERNGGHGDHDHKRRKRSSDQPLDVNVFSDSVSSVPHEHEEVSSDDNATTCRSAPLLISEYQLDPSVSSQSGIGSYQFGMLCPALVYLTVEKTCIKQEEDNATSPKASSVWGYGFLSITVISLLSFLGIAIVPVISKSFFDSLLSVLVAGAVGALCGDALLHLIPHSQSSSHDSSQEPIFKNLMVLAGIYLLFIVESTMKIFQHKKLRKKFKKMVSSKSNRNSRTETEEGVQIQVLGDGDQAYTSVDSNSNNKDVKEVDEALKIPPNHGEHAHDHKGHAHDHGGHAHDHGGHTHDHGDLEGKGVASMAWMVVAGDGMHNFSDGVAIGAAFTSSIVGGLSTSIAVFCHELPHELGDFALLMRAGMTAKQAMFYNGFAACIAYMGLVIGILIGNYAANVTPWIFAITAGMFLYVALVDMVPEMNSSLETKGAICTFVLQNVGLIVGVGIMVLISLYEDELTLQE